MKLIELQVKGFGRLVDCQFAFHPRMNIIFGSNEAGKSTLLQAILAMLYGFYDGQRASQKEKYRHERFRPWSSDEYAGHLKYAIDEGSTLVIHRDFSDRDIPTRLIDDLTGEDLTNQFRRGRHGRIDFIERQIGMGRAVFLATACVRHGALRSLESRDAGSVADAILRLLDSAATETSAEVAAERLDKSMRELSSARSPKALLTQARQRHESLMQSRELRLAAQKEIQSDIEKAGILELEIEELSDQIVAIDRQLLAVRIELLQRKLGRWQDREKQRAKLEEEIAGLKPFEDFPAAKKERFFQLRDDYSQNEKHKIVLSDERNRIELQLMGLDEKNKTINIDEAIWAESSFEDFLALRQRWQSAFDKIIDMESSKFDADRKLQAAGLDKDGGELLTAIEWERLEELKQRSAEIKEAEKEVDEVRREYDIFKKKTIYGRRVLAFVAFLASVVLLTVLVAFAQDRSSLSTYIFLMLSLVAITTVITLNARWSNYDRELGQTLVDAEHEFMEDRQELRNEMAKYGVKNIEQLIERRAQYIELGSAERTHTQQASEIEKIDQSLRPWVALVGAGEVAPETLQIVEAKLRESHRVWSEKASLKARLEEIENQEQQIDSKQERIVQELEEILSLAGISEPVGEIAFRSFITGCQKREYLDTLRSQMQQLEADAREIMEGAGAEQIKRQIEHLERERAAVPEPATDFMIREQNISEATRDKLQQTRESTVAELHKTQQKLSVVRERVATRLKDLPPLSEIDEEIALIEAEIERYENAREALELARDLITQSAQKMHRDFVPRLNESLSKYVQAITAGKYRDAMINPADFSVKVVPQDQRAPVDIEMLSFGTREQIYLLLRSVVVELFSQAGESVPMFWDDPLVHADEARVANALEVIDAIAENHQIFYFTKDRAIADYARRQYGSKAVIALS